MKKFIFFLSFTFLSSCQDHFSKKEVENFFNGKPNPTIDGLAILNNPISPTTLGKKRTRDDEVDEEIQNKIIQTKKSKAAKTKKQNERFQKDPLGYWAKRIEEAYTLAFGRNGEKDKDKNFLNSNSVILCENETAYYEALNKVKEYQASFYPNLIKGEALPQLPLELYKNTKAYKMLLKFDETFYKNYPYFFEENSTLKRILEFHENHHTFCNSKGIGLLKKEAYKSLRKVFHLGNGLHNEIEKTNDFFSTIKDELSTIGKSDCKWICDIKPSSFKVKHNQLKRILSELNEFLSLFFAPYNNELNSNNSPLNNKPKIVSEISSSIKALTPKIEKFLTEAEFEFETLWSVLINFLHTRIENDIPNIFKDSAWIFYVFKSTGLVDNSLDFMFEDLANFMHSASINDVFINFNIFQRIINFLYDLAIFINSKEKFPEQEESLKLQLKSKQFKECIDKHPNLESTKPGIILYKEHFSYLLTIYINLATQKHAKEIEDYKKRAVELLSLLKEINTVLSSIRF